MEKLVNDLTQKDETRALKAAQAIINEKRVDAFAKLSEKSDFLFDFVKNNVKNRLKKVINENNYRNIITFFDVYDENYADTFIEAVSQYASEDLSDAIYELLENGTINQKKYAAKYFSAIPDTIAQELLEKYAFDTDMELAINSAQALGAMNATESYNKAIQLLSDSDEFEVIKAVRFLTSYGDKSAVPNLLNTLETASAAENIAGEIPYLMPISEMLKTQDADKVLTCIDFILLGLSEILPLSDVFSYDIYNTIENLLNNETPNSHTATVLLRALDKFSTINENDEYSFDESKDVKNELKDILGLLNSKPKDFWTKQESLISKELNKSKQRAISALEIIRALEIKSAGNDLISFINSTSDEQLVVLSVGVAKSLNIIDKTNKNSVVDKVSNETLKVILESYFI